MGAWHGAGRAGADDEAADIAGRSVDHEVERRSSTPPRRSSASSTPRAASCASTARAGAVTGWSSADVVGRDARETVIPPEDHEAFGQMVAGMVAPAPRTRSRGSGSRVTATAA